MIYFFTSEAVQDQGEGEGRKGSENPKQTACGVHSPTRGSIP